MQYKYYDPPLGLFPSHDEEYPEALALRNELAKLEEKSFRNLDEAVARYDYELHFNHHVSIFYDKNSHVIEGPDLGKIALCRGGSVAVYRECIKRNVNVDQLLGLTDFRYPGIEAYFLNHETGELEPEPHSSAISLEEAYLGEVPGDYPEEYTADDIAHEDVIAYIKKRREEALEWQRQHKQPQQ